MMRPFHCIVLVAGMLFLAQTISADEPKATSDEPSVWMKMKLEYSKKIIEGLAAGDFDMIAKNASAMNGLNRIEDFVRGRTPGYRTQLRIFQHANEEIAAQAKSRNLEGVALAFNQLTMSCVSCHKQLRDPAEK